MLPSISLSNRLNVVPLNEINYNSTFLIPVKKCIENNDFHGAIVRLLPQFSKISSENEAIQCYECLFTLFPHFIGFDQLENNLPNLLSRSNTLPSYQYRLALHLARSYIKKGDHLHCRRAMFCLGKAVQIKKAFQLEECEDIHSLIKEIFLRESLTKSDNFKTERYGDTLQLFREYYYSLNVESNAIKVRDFQKNASENFKRLFQQLLDDVLMIIGPAPCLFDIRAMGSGGREELCPYSDIEIMVLIQNVNHRHYFLKLIKILELQIAFLAENQETIFIFTCIPNTHGFHLDNSPLQEERLIQTPESMAKLQKIKSARPEDIIHTVLKTSSLINDPPNLYDQYQDHLKSELLREQRALGFIAIRKKDFLERWKDAFNPDASTIHIKEQFVELLNHLLSDMALFFGIHKTNTLDIVDALVEEQVFTWLSGSIIKESIASIYKIRVRLHLEYKYQKEEATCIDLLKLNSQPSDKKLPIKLHSWEIFALEKTYWLVLSPLYKTLGSIIDADGLKNTFKEFDLMKVGSSPSSIQYQKKLAENLSNHFVEQNNYSQAIQCLALQGNTPKMHQASSKLFTKFLHQRLNEFLKNSRPSVEILTQGLKQILQWEIFCSTHNDLKPFYTKMWERISNIDSHLQMAYDPIYQQITEQEERVFENKVCTTERYHMALQSYKDAFSLDGLDVREFQRFIATEFKTFIHSLVQEIHVLLGPPPCAYDLLSMGSIAKEEAFPYSNFAFMILVENISYRSYFETFAEVLEMQIASLGETPLFAKVFHSFQVFPGMHVDCSPTNFKSLIQAPSAVEQSNAIEHMITTSSLYAFGNVQLFTQFKESLQKVLEKSREEKAFSFFSIRCDDYKNRWETPFNPETDIFQIKNQYVELLNYLLADMALFFGIDKINTLDIVDALSEGGIFNQESTILLKENIAAIFRLLQNKPNPGAILSSEEIFTLEKCYWLVLNPLYHFLEKTMEGSNYEKFKNSFKNVDLIKIAYDENILSNPKPLEPLIKQIALHLCKINAPLATNIGYVEKIAKAQPSLERIFLTTIEKQNAPIFLRIQSSIYTFNLCYEACLAGNLLQLQAWIKQDIVRLKKSDEQGENFFFAAVIGNQLPVLEWLYTQDPKSLCVCRNDGWTLMHAAAFYGHDSIVAWLHKKESKMIQVIDQKKKTALHIAAYQQQTKVLMLFIEECKKDLSFIETIIQASCPETIKFFFDQGLAPNLLVNKFNQTLLHIAASKGQLENAIIMLEHKVPVNAQDASKKTALYLATIHGHLSVVKYLLDNHADATICAEGKETILHAAAFYGHEDLLRTILNFPLVKKLLHQPDDDGKQPIHKAVWGEPKPNIIQILLDAGADPNARNSYDYTPIHWALKHGHIESAKVLIAAGADIEVINKNNQTPWDLAVNWGQDALIRAFLDIKQEEPANLSSQKKEELYESGLKVARENGFFKEQVFYLERLSDIYLEKSEWVKAAKILNCAFAICEKHLIEPHANKYLIAKLERIEALFLKSKGYRVSAHYRNFVQKNRILLKDMRETSMKELEKETVMHKLTDYYKQTLRLLIQNCQEQLGSSPPNDWWACIGMGLLAKNEISLYSGIKFTFLIKKRTDKALSYFRTLAQYLELRIINLGETPFAIFETEESPTPSGFSLDSGALAPMEIPEVYELIDTPEGLAQYQTEQRMNQNISLVAALSSVCHITGNEELTNQYKKAKDKQLSTTDNFIPLMGTSFGKKLALQLLQRDIITFKPNLTEKKEFDFKKELLRPLQITLDHLALFFDIKPTQSLQIIDELFKKNIISLEARKNIRQAFRTILSLVFKAEKFYKRDKQIFVHIELGKEKDPNLLYFNETRITSLQEIYRTWLPFYTCIQRFLKTGKREEFIKEKFYDETLSNQGKEFEKKQQYDKAKEAYQQAISLHPNEMESLLALGELEVKVEDYKHALQTHLKILELTKFKYKGENYPEFAECYQNIGNIYSKMKNDEKALEYEKRALDIILITYGENHPKVSHSTS